MKVINEAKQKLENVSSIRFPNVMEIEFFTKQTIL